MTLGLASARAIRPSRPPTDFAHCSASRSSSTQSIGGRVDGLALEDAFDQLAAFGVSGRSSAAARPACSFRGARRRAGERTIMPCAPSPPSTFCQDQVTTSSLPRVSSMREYGRGRVADGEAFAVSRDPVAVGHAHAGGRAVPGEDHVAVEVDLAQVGQLAVVGASKMRDVLQLELLATSVAQPEPKLSQATMSTPRSPEQRPHRHFDRAGVGGGHDADAVIRRHLAARRG